EEEVEGPVLLVHARIAAGQVVEGRGPAVLEVQGPLEGLGRGLRPVAGELREAEVEPAPSLLRVLARVLLELAGRLAPVRAARGVAEGPVARAVAGQRERLGFLRELGKARLVANVVEVVVVAEAVGLVESLVERPGEKIDRA